jgi:hypothetical protein
VAIVIVVVMLELIERLRRFLDVSLGLEELGRHVHALDTAAREHERRSALVGLVAIQVARARSTSPRSPGHPSASATSRAARRP